jgi:Nif-specific regulatory protein
MVQRKGRFELAHGGTLFLDEIGEISSAFQAKLLRVLQEGEFERVGGSRTLKVNVRLVTATNRNLEDAVAKGTFRADLYYRINVVPIHLPPLRDRREDIPLLANEFLRRFNAENDTRLSLSPSALAALAQCDFPGNVRELENCICRAATLARGDVLVDRDFACCNDGGLSSVLSKAHSVLQPCQPQEPAGCAPPVEHGRRPPGNATAGLQRAEKTELELLIEAMQRCGWVQAKAARLLGLTPRQIGYAIRKYGIEIPKL